MTWGASDGQEIPAGLIGGRNERGADPDVFDEADAREGDADVGASGDEPPHPTRSTLPNMSDNNDFIRHLSLWLTRPVIWLVYEQMLVPSNWRGFRQRSDVQSTWRQTYCPRVCVFYRR
jgi:hypothetical protein